MVEGTGFVDHVSNNRALLQHARVQNAAEHGTPRKHGFESRREGAKERFVRLYAARALQRFETRGDCSSPR